MTAPVSPPTPTPDPVKPGYSTTEFWLTLLGMILAGVVAVLAVFHRSVNTQALTGVVAAVAPLAAMIGAAVYSLSRAKVKAAAVAAAPALAASAPAPAPQALAPTFSFKHVAPVAETATSDVSGGAVNLSGISEPVAAEPSPAVEPEATHVEPHAPLAAPESAATDAGAPTPGNVDPSTLQVT